LTRIVHAFLGVMLMLFTASASFAADKAIIVLDASGSMWGQIDGKAKLEIARETLKTVLATVPADLELGLMAYGHREKGACDDIELLVPPAASTAEAISLAADNLKFLGKTPLSDAVRQAAEALRYTEDKATVILITDGLETCNADPCAVGTELEQSGVDFTAHVVGFGLTAEEGRQVACLAENTGGEYIQADDAAGLTDALTETVVAEPEPAPAPAPAPEPATPEFNLVPTMALAEGGPDITQDEGQSWVVHKANADGSRGEYVSTDYGLWKGSLEPGEYLLAAKIGHAEVEQPITIEADKVAEPHFVMNGGTLIIRVRPSEGADIADGAAINIRYPGDGDTTYYGQMKAVFPAGDLNLTVKLGAGTLTETIPIKAGETIDRDVVVGVGRVTANAFYVEGMKVEDGGVFVEFLGARKAIDGSRESFGNGYGPGVSQDLPAGDYVARASIGAATAEAPFSIKVGELTEASVVLNAGVLAITAPGGTFIEVFGGKDIAGNRKSFGNTYSDSYQTTLPAGDYTVSVERGDAGKKEAPASVKPGERSEVTVQ
jgi:Ca-activated chloride channel family protein